MSKEIFENPLGSDKISKLLRSYAIPSIAATLVGSLYNIVDQVFIGQGVGYVGNAATNVSYPLSTICLAISLLIGIGSASRFSLYLGQNAPERAARIAGSGVCLMAGAGLLYLVLGELFLTPLLKVFGATQEVLPYAQQYAGITLLGMPLLILTNGIQQFNPRRWKSQILYDLHGVWCNCQHHSGPAFHFSVSLGCGWCCLGHSVGASSLFSFGATVFVAVSHSEADKALFCHFYSRHLENPLHGNQQLHKPSSHYSGTDCAKQFPHPLWGSLLLWRGNSVGSLRYCHENKRYFAFYYCGHLPGDAANYWIQLWCGENEAGKKCLSAGTEMELCGFCSGVFTLSVFPAPHHFPIWQREFSVL